MPNVFLNGSPCTFDPTPATWNDLLNGLDRQLESDGRAIAGVRFDGIDEPAFRDPALLARALTPSLMIEIDVEPQSALILRALNEAALSIPEISQAAVDLAANYRLVDVTQANAELGVLAEALSNLMALVGAASQVLRVDLLAAPAPEGGMPSAEVMPELDAALRALIEAHGGQDWITLADSLEYDVAPLVSRLSGLVEHLESCAAAA
jgi:hypothetical protein